MTLTTQLPPRVLLVEDNPDDLELALLAFERAGVDSRVDVVRNGVEALDHLLIRSRDGGELPRMVLLDIKLPLVDGVDVLRRMKSDEALRHVPVVMLTTSYHERDVLACSELGANSYVVKPVDMDSFLEAIRDLARYWLTVNQVPGSGLGAMGGGPT